ncbi:hypothetical protein [Caldibacillus thermoamylovorans]|nr:hypothetical protein [Caldibacillus thermoamylovorans]MCM3475970.1 hypothetical protein [Caldibacillus thermoamylovorans]
MKDHDLTGKKEQKQENHQEPSLKEEKLNAALLYTPEIITWIDQTNSTDE